MNQRSIQNYDQDVYFPQQAINTRKKYKKLKWTSMEHKKYMEFLALNQSLFSCQYSRRKCKVFKLLSDAVGTKKPNQCKSHHQKIMKRYKTFAELVLFLKIQIPNYAKQYILSEIQTNDSNKEFQVKESISNAKQNTQLSKEELIIEKISFHENGNGCGVQDFSDIFNF